ncbi:MAG: fumarate reductase/succinate dehydrogenase flavoprotein subunit, partial [Ornithinimicrobium sp.]
MTDTIESVENDTIGATDGASATLTETEAPRADTDIFTEGDPISDGASPSGPIAGRWEQRKFEAKLVNPANRRKLSVIIVGTGLAGASAGATMGEAGYHV